MSLEEQPVISSESPHERALRAWRQRTLIVEAERRATEKREQQARQDEHEQYLRELHARYEREWRQTLTVDWRSESPDLNFVARALYHVLPQGYPDAVEAAIRFLEADPRFTTAGYRKRDITRRLTRLDLPEPIRERLRRLVLHRIESDEVRGMRHYCQLARRVDTPAFREAVRRRLGAPDAEVRRRATWISAALDAAHARFPPILNSYKD